MDGFLNILKPPGMSSAAVVGFAKRHIDKQRVGHAGTLDPEAAGVLPIMIGRAARLFDYLADKEKTYTAEIAFGCATDSQDAQGQVTASSDKLPNREEIENVLPLFLGKITQTPSAFSAIKQNGRPLYELARKGETVIVPKREITVDTLTLLEQTSADGFMLRIECGRGSYVRTICHDIGSKLNCPAHMRFLLREKTGAFDLKSAMTLEEIKAYAESGTLAEKLLPMDMPLMHMPRIDVPNGLFKAAKNGAKMPLGAFANVPEGYFRLYMAGHFMGIAHAENEVLRYRTMVYEEKNPCE
jgi:tRNA pseudouridine 55 synthase